MVAVENPVRMTFQFGLHGPAAIEEIAEFNLWSDLSSADLPDDWDAALLDLGETCYTAWGDNADEDVFRASVTLEQVKTAHLSTTLHTLHEQIYSPTTKWAGDSSNPSLPWQCSLCIGLYSYTPGSFIPNARNRRGRIYLPPMAIDVLDVATKGTLSDGRFLATLTGVAAMLHDIQASIATGTSQNWSLGVLSQVVNKVKITPPNIWGLTDVVADQVIDTQRRRTHQELKVRQSVEVT